ncbi:hypothetical protein, partial [Burkholderia multivorans]|uniref:hypothetical protein n=1 Tax=Burkholderia multivorans TaxID=87883 RepID=UPI0021BEDCF0
ASYKTSISPTATSIAADFLDDAQHPYWVSIRTTQHASRSKRSVVVETGVTVSQRVRQGIPDTKAAGTKAAGTTASAIPPDGEPPLPRTGADHAEQCRNLDDHAVTPVHSDASCRTGGPAQACRVPLFDVCVAYRLHAARSFAR